MRPFRRRRFATRRAHFETMEPRLVMSGAGSGDFVLEYFAEDVWEGAIGTSLVEAHELTGLAEARSEYGLTGQGQTVVVIDTGIAYDHQGLGGGLGPNYHVVGAFDFTEERDADPYDDGPFGSHGTHVAGIIGSTDVAHPGVAPGADLVGLRVFNDAGEGDYGWVEEALAWVHDNRLALANPITTVNLSLGADWNSGTVPWWATMEDELAQLEADGIFISAAAGNRFAAYDEPGLTYPAASDYVVPVSAVDGDGRLSYFSQRHARAIAAPGRSVLSTVPDYAGNGNGVADDFARYSGTSMAAPYVAGASVLLREAYEFAGVTGVTQDTLYELMRATSDRVYDPVTEASYRRLNVQRALDRIMPEDDFSSDAWAAYDLGTISDTLSAAGTVGQLDDLDYFAFTAAQTGQAVLTTEVTHAMEAQWHLVGDGRATEDADGTFSFEVSAGETYTVGLGTAGGVGHYTIDVALDWDALPPADEGIRQEVFADNRVSAAGHWFSFTTAAEGILTVEALFSHSAGDVDLQLLDGQLPDGSRRPIGGSYSVGDSERIDVTVDAGETFYVYAYVSGAGVNEDVDFRITNLVSQAGEEVAVAGTDGDDRFALAAGSTHEITINGVAYRFDGRAVRSINFDGLAGSDTVTLNGTMSDETAVLRVGSADLTGPGYAARAVNVETVTVRGGGGSDVAFLYDSAGDDTLTATPEEVHLAGRGFSSRVAGFETVHAYAKAGGFDVAELHGSAGNDTFIGTPSYGKLVGEGYFLRAKYFESVSAYAGAGGLDVAKLYDSKGDDTFLATPGYGRLFGKGFDNRAEQFDAVHGYAKAGGSDTAELFDSAGDDTFVSTPVYASLSGSGLFCRAKFFEEVFARGSEGGFDRAFLHASAGYGLLKAADDLARISGAAGTFWAYGFEAVSVRAGGNGAHRAEIAAVDYVLALLGDWE